MRTQFITLLSISLMLSGCPDRPSTGEPAAKAPAEPAKEAPAEPAKGAPVEPPAEIGSVNLGPLKAEPLAKVVAKLTAAHYDAESLGLKGLEGTVEMTSTKLALLARAKVKWSSGSPPEVQLIEVEKDGKKIPAPTGDQPEEIGRAIGWADLQFKILKLVEGLGNGYLAHRLLEWKEAKGTATLEGDTLRLQIDQGDQGTVKVEVGKGYVVRKVKAAHPKGFTRSMTYEVQANQGRNLVTGAVLKATANKGAKLHKRADMMLKAIDGTRFEIGYGKAGRFLLPVKLRKVVSSMKEELIMAITYGKVTP